MSQDLTALLRLISEMKATMDQQEEKLKLLLDKDKQSCPEPLIMGETTQISRLAKEAYDRINVPGSMDVRLYTFDLVRHVPVYIMNYSVQDWFDKMFIFTDTMYYMLSEEQRAQLSSLPYQRLLGISSSLLPLDEDSLQLSSIVSSTRLSYSTLSNIISTYGMELFERMKLSHSSNSLFLSPLRQRIDIEGVEFMDETLIFNGLSVKRTYVLSKTVSEELFRTMVLKALRISLDKEEGIQYSLQAQYLIKSLDKIRKKSIMLSRDLIKEPHYNLMEYYESNPRDYMYEFEQKGELDRVSFTIIATKVRMSGGAIDEEMIKKAIGANRTIDMVTEWGVVKLIRSTDIDSCFWDIMVYVLKKEDKLPKGVGPNRLREQHGMSKGPVELGMALKVAESLGLYMFIYSLDGRILSTNHPIWIPGDEDIELYLKEAKDTVSVDLECVENRKRIDLLLTSDHYFLVTSLRFMERTYSAHYKSLTSNSDGRHHMDINVYYDIETVVMSQHFGIDETLPYAVSWASDYLQYNNHSIDGREFYEGNKGTIITSSPSLRLFSTMLQSIIASIIDKEIENDSDITYFINMIAFNGANFDHLFLFSYLSTQDYECLKAPDDNNNVKSMIFLLHNERIPLKYGEGDKHLRVILKVWDPCLFLQGSLDKLCNEFKISLRKLEYDHTLVQEAYDTFQFDDYIDTYSKDICQYVENDVEMVRLLVEEFIKVTLPLDVLKSPTISSLAYREWVSTIGHKDFGKIVGLKWWDEEKDRLVRKGIIGGRVECRKGSYKSLMDQMCLVDKVSLYPYVMESHSYLCGKSTLVSSVHEYECKGYIALVSFDQSKLKVPLMPSVTEDGRYDWTYKGEWEGIMDSDTISYLQSLQVPVVFKGPMIIFEDSRPLFQQYIEKYKNIKEEQDSLRTRRDARYNGGLREFGKMMLNSVFGRTIMNPSRKRQRIFRKPEEYKRYVEGGNFLDITYFSNHSGIITLPANRYKKNLPSWLGLQILMASKVDMHRSLLSKVDYIYTDTDSAIAPRSQLLSLLKEGPKAFGDLVMEGLSSHVIIVSPKCYYFNREIWRIKGVRRDDIAISDLGERLMIKLNPGKVFEWILKQGHLKIEGYQFLRSIKDRSVRRVLKYKVLSP